MSFRLISRVRDVTASTGTGTLTVAATPPVRARAFAAYPVGSYTLVAIEHLTLDEWEICLVQVVSATSLRRVLVLESSNGNALVPFSAGTKQVYVVDPATLAQPDPQLLFRAEWEGISNGVTDAFTSQVSGTGAANNAVALALADDEVGALESALGTTATGRAAVASPNMAVMNLGNGPSFFSARHRLSNLSDATNTYTERAGFLDSVSAEPTDGAYFRYVHSANGGRWLAVTRSNGAESTADTGVAASTAAWAWLEVAVESGSLASFYINGARVAELTTNIPVATGRELGWGAAAIRSAGTAAFNARRLGYMRVMQFFTGAR